MNSIIIVEGPQGVGKSTITNWLRERIPYTNLFRLSGHDDISMEGLRKSKVYHTAILRTMWGLSDCGLNFILDRSFVSEEVYCRLGFKEYSFTGVYTYLVNDLEKFSNAYDITYINLHCANNDVLRDRLRRDKPQYSNVSFGIENSLRQQDMYRVAMNEMKTKCPHVHFLDLCTTYEEDWKYDLFETFKLIMKG